VLLDNLAHSLKPIHHRSVVARGIRADLGEEEHHVERDDAPVGEVRGVAPREELVELGRHGGGRGNVFCLSAGLGGVRCIGVLVGARRIVGVSRGRRDEK
jgi:hypothetical protein